jgi:hypothetical protein
VLHPLRVRRRWAACKLTPICFLSLAPSLPRQRLQEEILAIVVIVRAEDATQTSLTVGINASLHFKAS